MTALVIATADAPASRSVDVVAVARPVRADDRRVRRRRWAFATSRSVSGRAQAPPIAAKVPRRPPRLEVRDKCHRAVARHTARRQPRARRRQSRLHGAHRQGIEIATRRGRRARRRWRSRWETLPRRAGRRRSARATQSLCHTTVRVAPASSTSATIRLGTTYASPASRSSAASAAIHSPRSTSSRPERQKSESVRERGQADARAQLGVEDDVSAARNCARAAADSFTDFATTAAAPAARQAPMSSARGRFAGACDDRVLEPQPRDGNGKVSGHRRLPRAAVRRRRTRRSSGTLDVAEAAERDAGALRGLGDRRRADAPRIVEPAVDRRSVRPRKTTSAPPRRSRRGVSSVSRVSSCATSSGAQQWRRSPASGVAPNRAAGCASEIERLPSGA